MNSTNQSASSIKKKRQIEHGKLVLSISRGFTNNQIIRILRLITFGSVVRKGRQRKFFLQIILIFIEFTGILKGYLLFLIHYAVSSGIVTSFGFYSFIIIYRFALIL